jgi:hypothetical protein
MNSRVLPVAVLLALGSGCDGILVSSTGATDGSARTADGGGPDPATGESKEDGLPTDSVAAEDAVGACTPDSGAPLPPDSGGPLPPPSDSGGPPAAPPSLPALGPSGFHTVTAANLATWNSLLTLGTQTLIAAQNQPPGVPASKWVKNIHPSQYATAEAMADGMHQLFASGTGPVAILIDEVKTATESYIVTVADRMRTVYPQWTGRWGAYLVNGTAIAYPNLAPAIDALLEADAIIAVEMYPYLADYCAGGTTTVARDIWLGDFFHGSRGAFPQGRFHWLAQRRTAKGSASHLTVVFGVTDKFVGGSGAAIFIDRMFYVWVTRSNYPSTISLQNGGPGAWKWDGPAVGNTSRDLAFAESFEHYVVQGKTSSRLGPVSCP